MVKRVAIDVTQVLVGGRKTRETPRPFNQFESIGLYSFYVPLSVGDGLLCLPIVMCSRPKRISFLSSTFFALTTTKNCTRTSAS